MPDGQSFFPNRTGASSAFKAEVDAFLDSALTEDLRAAGRATVGMHSETEACQKWWRLLLEHGSRHLGQSSMAAPDGQPRRGCTSRMLARTAMRRFCSRPGSERLARLSCMRAAKPRKIDIFLPF